MTARIKPTAFRTYAEFTDAVDEVARKQVDLTKLKARRDSRIQNVEAEFKDDIERIEGEISELVVLAEKYAVVHRAEIFSGETKTGASASANFGFRLGNPTLKALNRRWSQEETMKELRRLGMVDFIRVKEELDKNGLKARLSDEQLASVGLRVCQSEAFFIEPLAETAESVAA